MYYIDTNILIYVNDTESPYHQSASEIFYNLLEQNKIILHEIVLTEFFSVITDSRRMESPWSTSQARDYIKDLLESVHELHFLHNEIISAACKYIKKYDIKRYDIYDHLIAYSMKFYKIDKIVTLNKTDFERYDFIEEIISPSS
jgi:predicted nucleic acid-binding protein